MSSPSNWSSAEFALLDRMFPFTSAAAVAAWLDRSVASVRVQAGRRGIVKDPTYLASDHYRSIHGGRKVLSPAEMLAWLTENVRIDEDGCRIWAGTRTIENTPKVSWHRKEHSAKRLLLELLGRPPKRGHVTWSICGKPLCMNPDCVKSGTHKAAASHHKARGAYQSGAMRSLSSAIGRAKTAKLPITERAAVYRLRAQGLTLREIGERYGVRGSAVGHAIDTWRRIDQMGAAA